MILEWILSHFKPTNSLEFEEKGLVFKSATKYIPPYDPAYATLSSAGMDVMADIDGHIVIPAGGWKLVPTGIYLSNEFRAFAVNLEIQVRSRSGLALKKGLFVLNSPGTVDSDYPGEIGVILANHSEYDVKVEQGERIAQLVINRIERPGNPRYFKDSIRTGGYGSTGT